MVEFQLGSARQPLRRILCLGSHCDDIEIGCGGAILRLLGENPEIEIYWLVFSATPVRKKEALRAANLFLASAKKKKIEIRSYRDSFFPSQQTQIKGEFEKLKKEFAPDLILTHYRYDLHQDHRVICELTWNTFRSHLILEYEIPKYDGDLGIPNFFVGLDRTTCERSEEHTSELQSLAYLVCRLLLEKKNLKSRNPTELRPAPDRALDAPSRPLLVDPDYAPDLITHLEDPASRHDYR